MEGFASFGFDQYFISASDISVGAYYFERYKIDPFTKSGSTGGIEPLLKGGFIQ
jgi:hypothetical protein